MNKAKLGDVCTIVSGSTPKTTDNSLWNGGIPWVTPAELDGSHYINQTERTVSEEGLKAAHLRLFPKGTVLLSSRAPIGKVAVAAREMTCNQGFKNLICHDAIHNEYLFWFLKSKNSYLNSLGRGATFKELSKRLVESIEIPLPSLRRQEEIAGLFSQIECITQQFEAVSNQLDVLVKSRFVEMFGDLKRNPKGFDTVALNELCEIKNGFAFKSKEYVSEGIRIIRISNVQKGYLKDSSPCYYPSEALSQITDYLLKEGDLLISLTGNVGRVGLLPQSMMPAALNQRVACLRVRDPRLDKQYLFRLLNMDSFEQDCINSSKGLAQKNMSTRWLGQYPIPIPPLWSQTLFAQFAKEVDKSKFAIQKAIDKLEMLKASLMQEYFG